MKNDLFSKVDELYLSFVNDFLTVGRFAEYYGITEEKAAKLIETGRKVHDRVVYNTFKVHGVYSWSNACGCEIELSNDGESARLRYPDSRTVSQWYEIEQVWPTEYDEPADGEQDFSAENVIDPDGHNIPLSLVMRA